MSSSALSLTCALGGGGCLTLGSRGVDLDSDRVMGVAAGRLMGMSDKVMEPTERVVESLSRILICMSHWMGD